MRSLVWFRADLRIRDNPALSEACRNSDEGVMAVFCACPAQWRAHGWAAIKVDLLLRHLTDLSQSLNDLNIPLLLRRPPRFADVAHLLLDLAECHRCDALWFNREYEVNECHRDAQVTDRFVDAGKAVHAWEDQSVIAPATLHTTNDTFYSVFTPFRKKWIATVKGKNGPRVRRAPRAQPPLDIAADPIPTALPAFRGLTRPDLWKAGEAHALSRLRAFVQKRAVDYEVRRDLPAANGTSVLSPYLALGAVSARQCLKAAMDANDGRLDSGLAGLTTWITELIWREFYRHVLVGFPQICMHKAFDRRMRTIPWRNDKSGFARWCQGTTGIPIVDAGMRQLLQTGWMHNRLRMITAMFLTKNLFIDWRRGERFFMQHLVDGDFANNNGGWQWSASVGPNASPYFRIFNPISQSQRFDPEGHFIRKFVPELAQLPADAVHLPAKDESATDYPAPIVDLKASRQRAIDQFKKYLSSYPASVNPG